jgi:hypothetical protein
MGLALSRVESATFKPKATGLPIASTKNTPAKNILFIIA